MKRNAGVWLDNRKAIIVFVDTAGRSLQQIDSGVEGRVTTVRRFADPQNPLRPAGCRA